MTVIDTRKLEYPIVTIRHHEVMLDVGPKETHVFSKKAWNFFAQHLLRLISLDTRAEKSHPDFIFGRTTKCLLVDDEELYGMGIYPSNYVDEWFVEFFENGDGSKVRFKTHLRTSLAQGSVYKKDQLVELFQPITNL